MIGKIIFVHTGNWWIPSGETLGSAEVGAWLADEIQYSQNSIKWYEKLIENEMRDGSAKGCIASGNAHHMFVLDKKVLLQCEYIEDQLVLLTKEDLLQALRMYSEFLKGDFKDLSVTPDSFPMHYISEGSKAKEQFVDKGGVFEKWNLRKR